MSHQRRRPPGLRSTNSHDALEGFSALTTLGRTEIFLPIGAVFGQLFMWRRYVIPRLHAYHSIRWPMNWRTSWPAWGSPGGIMTNVECSVPELPHFDDESLGLIRGGIQ